MVYSKEVNYIDDIIWLTLTYKCIKYTFVYFLYDFERKSNDSSSHKDGLVIWQSRGLNIVMYEPFFFRLKTKIR